MGRGPRGTGNHAHPACSIDIGRFQTALGVRRRVMTFLRWNRLPALGAGLLLLACGGDGGGGTGPWTPGPATQLVKNGGDGPSPYGNKPLPTPLHLIVPDAHNCPLPRVLLNCAIQTRGG